MKAVNRNSFIVSKALKTFVMAAVLTAAASQLAHTADSMIVGHVVGPDAVSAINLVLPFADIDRFFKDNKVSAADAFKINICTARTPSSSGKKPSNPAAERS